MTGSQLRFDGRVVAVTGAGRGLGREFALLLASRGAAVVVNDIGVSADANRYSDLAGDGHNLQADAARRDAAEEVAGEIRAAGGRAVANTADICDPAAAASIVTDAIGHFGRVDVLINNAGVVITSPFPELTERDMAMTFNVHVNGAFNVVTAAWQHLGAQGYGRIVNIGSAEGGLIGSPGFEVYAAAKGGMVAMTKALSRMGVPVGVRANCVLPAGRTRASVRSGRNRKDSVDRRPALVAPPVAWLSHEDCDVSGEVFAVSLASMRLVFNSIGAGYRHAGPGEPSVGELASHWDEICQREPSTAPREVAEFDAQWLDTVMAELEPGR
jgi:NAD(P)-dependent dehydrogenase (short-subunit alcohol dehydrogenase family)